MRRGRPGARVVKAFNTVGPAFMVHPSFAEGTPDMFICGNDAAAQRTVTELLRALGWPAVDLGGIEGARLLEGCILWVTYGLRTGTGAHAFTPLKG